MEIIVRGRHVTVPPRFRQHAAAKLAKLEKLDQKAVRVDVEVSEERNPRQSDRRERVELTIRSRGPAIRAEAAADDRYTALDLAFAKLESRLRRAADRRKIKHGDKDNVTVRSPGMLSDVTPAAATPAIVEPAAAPPEPEGVRGGSSPRLNGDQRAAEGGSEGPESDTSLVAIPMEGDGPLVVREKVHLAKPMTIEQALYEMELIGHDFYLFHDCDCDRFSVVYRRRGYDYGVIRLVEE
jgi:ribosomal subunit interface protein